MDSAAQFLLTLGGILLLGLTTSAIGRKTPLPRVTLLLIFGVFIGSDGLDIIPAVFTEHFELIADMTLVMVGFLLGGKLSRDTMGAGIGRVMWISITAAMATAILVSLGLWWAGVPAGISILLGCIASATAPAAIFDVVTESGHSGEFEELLLSIVAVDDVWALILFGFGIAVVSSMNGQAHELSSLMLVLREIGGAVVLGLLLGFPAAYLTGRIQPGQPVLSEALGLVFVCGGLALWFETSFLIASMVMGAVVANFAKHHEYPFHAIEDIESPFMVAFFVLAGASLEVEAMAGIGLIGTVYILCRALGKVFGAWLGSEFSSTGGAIKHWMGIALLPHAGVAIGMALVASHYFPQYEQILLTVVISSTVLFEIIGPVCTRLAISQASKSQGVGSS